MEDKSYVEVNGTSYDSRTPKLVIDLLEKARQTKQRVRLFYGDPKTGKKWADPIANRGTIGRSTGSQKIPLLVKNSRSMGGEAILDYCIVEIQESAGGIVLYRRYQEERNPCRLIDCK